MTVFTALPGLEGSKRGSELAAGSGNVNSVELGTRNGVANAGYNVLDFRKVTECGSGTVVGLSHITLSPDLISIHLGTNSVNTNVAFPTPACTIFVEGCDGLYESGGLLELAALTSSQYHSMPLLLLLQECNLPLLMPYLFEYIWFYEYSKLFQPIGNIL